MSKRTRRKTEKPIKGEARVAQEVVNPDASELKVVVDNLRTQIEGIDSKLKNINEKIPQVDLKVIEDKMTLTIDKVNAVNNSLADLEKYLDSLVAYAKIFFGISTLGLIVLLFYTLKTLKVL